MPSAPTRRLTKPSASSRFKCASVSPIAKPSWWCVEPAAEEHGHQLGGRARLRDGAERLREPLVVMMPQVIEARVEAAER
jgi:hypothetical protein